MRVNALVRVAVERWTQVTPKSVEVKMLPAFMTAVWYWPVEDNEMERQLKLVARDVHVSPKSEDVMILPPFATAL